MLRPVAPAHPAHADEPDYRARARAQPAPRVPSRVLIPLGVDRPLKRRSAINPSILAAMVVAYFIQLLAQAADADVADRLLAHLALDPDRATPWSYVTYAFLHDPSSPFHLMFNALFLWVFGPSVEDRLGRIGYPAFFLLGAAASGFAHTLVSHAPVIGASGAISGVGGAFLVLFPRTRIKTFCFFIIVGFLSIPAYWFIAIAIIRDFAPLGLDISDGVAHAAHLGGYLFGIATAAGLLAAGVLKREPHYDLVSILRHRSRRQGFTAARRIQSGRAPTDKAEPADPDPLALARAAVTEALGRADIPGAIGAYRALLAQHARSPGALALSRRAQYDLANHIFQSGDHALAAAAYQGFLDAYPRDPEAADVKLLLATIRARYLNDPVGAKALLHEIVGEHRDPARVEQAQRELADLG